MRALRAMVAFLTVVGRPPKRVSAALADLGRTFWWAAPLVGIAAGALTTAFGLGVNRVSGSVGVTVACFMLFDHGLNGMRRIDGLADLADGLVFRYARREAGLERAWQVVRSPQAGPGGCGAVTLLLLLDWSLLTTLLSHSRQAFIVAVLLAATLSKSAVAFAAGGSWHFRSDSDFAPFAAELGRFPRQFLVTVLAFVLGLAAVSAFAGFPIPPPIPLLRVALMATGAAIIAGLASRFFLVRALGHLNGDVIGFSWSLASTAVLLAVHLSRWP